MTDVGRLVGVHMSQNDCSGLCFESRVWGGPKSALLLLLLVAKENTVQLFSYGTNMFFLLCVKLLTSQRQNSPSLLDGLLLTGL